VLAEVVVIQHPADQRAEHDRLARPADQEQRPDSDSGPRDRLPVKRIFTIMYAYLRDVVLVHEAG